MADRIPKLAIVIAIFSWAILSKGKGTTKLFKIGKILHKGLLELGVQQK